MAVTCGLWSDVFRVLALDRGLSGASLCSCFSNFRFHLPKTGSIVDGDRFDKAFHLLGPRVGQSLRKPGDGKIGWRGAVDRGRDRLAHVVSGVLPAVAMVSDAASKAAASQLLLQTKPLNLPIFRHFGPLRSTG
jgi:hypothetical protein